MKKKSFIIFVIIIILLLIVVGYGVLKCKKKYDISRTIDSYNLQNYEQVNEYIEYIKAFVKPEKLKSFVYNDYITLSQYNDAATGYTVKNQMEFKAYKMLFTSMFDKTRTNFDDCPVTENFTNKFKTNLLEHFDLIESEDCESNCLLDRDKQEIKVEVYGNFKNTEPTYWTNHYFNYTLDDEGNVDNVIFNYTEK
ncbi:MAG: hypothetical protein J6P02_04210 [Lachnospiraceae bacterium]|nr:hypothetical protein [Lachnospiraceae bacterium]